MTDELQVMDVIVNSPLKAAVRRARCSALFDYFQDWKLRRLLAEKNKTDPVDFPCPVPEYKV